MAEIVLAASTLEHVREVTKTDWTVELVLMSCFTVFFLVLAELDFFSLVFGNDFDVALLRFFLLFLFPLRRVIGGAFRVLNSSTV